MERPNTKKLLFCLYLFFKFHIRSSTVYVSPILALFPRNVTLFEQAPFSRFNYERTKISSYYNSCFINLKFVFRNINCSVIDFIWRPLLRCVTYLPKTKATIFNIHAHNRVQRRITPKARLISLKVPLTAKIEQFAC